MSLQLGKEYYVQEYFVDERSRSLAFNKIMEHATKIVSNNEPNNPVVKFTKLDVAVLEFYTLERWITKVNGNIYILLIRYNLDGVYSYGVRNATEWDNIINYIWMKGMNIMDNKILTITRKSNMAWLAITELLESDKEVLTSEELEHLNKTLDVLNNIEYICKDVIYKMGVDKNDKNQ